MSVPGQSARLTLSSVITQHVRRVVRRETARHRSDIGRVTSTNPLRIYLQGVNLELPAHTLYFHDGCPPGKLRVNDNVSVTHVDGEAIVHDVIRRAGTKRLSGSTTLTIVNSAGKTSKQLDELFVRPPPNGTMLSDETNGLLLVRQAGKWTKATMTVIP